MMLNEEVWMLDSKNAFLLSMVVVTLKPSNFTDDLFLRSDTNETWQQVISLRCEQISHVVLSVFPCRSDHRPDHDHTQYQRQELSP